MELKRLNENFYRCRAEVELLGGRNSVHVESKSDEILRERSTLNRIDRLADTINMFNIFFIILIYNCIYFLFNQILIFFSLFI